VGIFYFKENSIKLALSLLNSKILHFEKSCQIHEGFRHRLSILKENKRSKTNHFQQVLLVLSRIHDPIDGMDISAEPVVEEHITRLLSNSGNSKPVPQFICYTCPHLSSNLEDFGHHLKTTGHLTATSLWATTKSGNALRCDACDATFANLQNVTLHSYSRIHQVRVARIINSHCIFYFKSTKQAGN